MPERRVDALTIVIDTDTGPVRLAAAEIEAYLSAIRDERVNIDIDVDASKVLALNKAMKGAKSDLAALERELERSNKGLHRNSTLYKKLDPLTRMFIDNNWDTIKSLKANEKGVKKLTPAVQDLTKAQQALAGTVLNVTERQKAAADTNNRAAKAARAREKAEADLEKQIERQDATYRKQLATQQRANDENQKFDLNIAKLIQRHAELEDQLAKTSGKTAFLKTPQDIAKIQRLRAEIEYTRDAFRRLGGDMSLLDGHSERNQNSLANLVDQLSRVRLHLGFFSLNVKQAAYALTAFGPVISGLLGAFSSLIGVLGTGLVGALGLAGAAMGGFLMNAAGIGFALKPLIKEFTTATDAATDYYEQVIETGKGSEEAQDALKEYQTVLKNLPPETRGAVVEFGKMRASWMKVSEELRKPFFDLMADGMNTLNSLMPMFQRNTVKAFGAASKGVKQWLSGLRGPEARAIMDTLMQQMTAATPALLSGLGNIVTAFGRLSEAASGALPGVMKTFDRWSQGLADKTASDSFGMQVDQMIENLKSVGQMATAAGRVLITFFSTGASAGKTLTETITGTLNRWNSWMKSMEGQQSLKQFFDESVKEMSNLYDIIAPMVKIFAKFVQTMRPVSVAFQRIAATGLELLNIIMQIPLAAQLIAAALTGKMVVGIVGSVKALAFAFGALRTRLLGASAASATTAASMAQLKVAMTGVAASPLPGVTKQATVAATGISRLALAGRGLMGLFGGPLGLALTGATIGLMVFGDELASLGGPTQTFSDRMKSIAENQEEANAAISQASMNIKQAQSGYKDLAESVRDYNQAVEEGRRPDKSLGELNQQQEQVNRQQRQAVMNIKDYVEGLRTARGEARNLLDIELSSLLQPDRAGKGGGGTTFGAAADEVRELRQMMNQGVVPSVRRLNNLFKDVKLSPELRTALEEWAIRGFDKLGGQVNAVRVGLKNVVLPPQLQRSVGQLLSELPKQAGDRLGQAFARMEPEAVRKTTNLLRRLTATGRTGEAVKLAAKIDPKNVEPGLRAIRRRIKELDIPEAKVKIKPVEGGFKALMKSLTKPDRKDVKVALPNLETVSNRLDRWLNQEETKSVVINPRLSRNSFPITLTGPGFARGGEVGPDTKRAAPGQRVNSPMFMVGEENRTEFVIATNPAYRKNNLQYWAEAGAALGIPGFAGGGKNGRKPPKPVKKGVIFGGGNTKPPRNVSAPGLLGDYDWYNKLIAWSQTETSNTRAEMDAKLQRGSITQLDYGALLSDIGRTEDYYLKLNNTIAKLMGKAKQKALVGKKHSLKKNKPKREDYPKTDEGGKRFEKDKRVWENNQNIEKENKQKLRDYYSERIDIGQALDALKIQKMELENERDTGGPLGVSPGVTEAINLLAGGYALQQQFGSNMFGGSASIGGGGSFIAPGGTLPAAPPTENMGAAGVAPRMGGPGAAAAGGKTVNITNNYQEQPADPHTWSKNLAWEVGVA